MPFDTAANRVQPLLRSTRHQEAAAMRHRLGSRQMAFANERESALAFCKVYSSIRERCPAAAVQIEYAVIAPPVL
jgi:hypothetical protein